MFFTESISQLDESLFSSDIEKRAAREEKQKLQKRLSEIESVCPLFVVVAISAYRFNCDSVLFQMFYLIQNVSVGGDASNGKKKERLSVLDRLLIIVAGDRSCALYTMLMLASFGWTILGAMFLKGNQCVCQFLERDWYVFYASFHLVYYFTAKSYSYDVISDDDLLYVFFSDYGHRRMLLQYILRV